MVQKVPNTMLEDAAPDLIGLVPVGAPLPYFGASAPVNWVFAYGQQLAKADYPALWEVLQEVGGAATATHFRVPDLRGRSIFGRDNMGGTPANRVTSAGSGIDAATLGASGGNQAMQQHNHAVTDPGHTHTVMGSGTSNNGADTSEGMYGVGQGGVTINSATTGISVQSTGTGNAQNMPPAIVANWIIRAK